MASPSGSLQARIASFLVRHRVRPRLGDMSDIARVRRVFGQALPGPRGVAVRADTVGGVAGEWVEPAGGLPPSAPTLLYLHGGGFVGCSARTHRPITAALALARDLRVFVPDYRLAPEHPFPSRGTGRRAGGVPRTARRPARGRRLVVAGDSAGGNLALGPAAGACATRVSLLPDAAALFSPALDLTGGSDVDHAATPMRDAMFHGPTLQQAAAALPARR